MTRRVVSYFFILSLVIFCLQACVSYYYFRGNYQTVNELIHNTKKLNPKPYLKAHLKSGDVCILWDQWKIDTLTNTLSGNGKLYDFNRAQIDSGALTISIDKVTIFETNTKLLNPEENRIMALSILAGVDVIIGLLCLTNPKACFGSCPTFYLNDKDNFHFSDAEGFSNAIAPSLEYSDIDALGRKLNDTDTFSITMKNEALETHCVRNVSIMVYPLEGEERVFQSPANDFFLCNKFYGLSGASGFEGDITPLLKDQDKIERYSPSDEKNLISKEEIFLNFDQVDLKQELGLILHFRQTLMTTYFIYNAISYMGDEVSDIFAKIENDNETKNKLDQGLKKELGNIEIYTMDEETKKWVHQSGFYETGPVAINKQMIPLNVKSGIKKLRIKIVLNKGLWRMDYVALAGIKKKVSLIEISPVSIMNKGVLDHQAHEEIINPDKFLISMPGSAYKINFKLPTVANDFEFFLCSKGYYLEWMRKDWIKDKDLLKLKQMIYEPRKYLKDQAIPYKEYERNMEQQFWNSKIDTKTFSYYEK
ncbi:MAG: hypothetical protein IPP06_14955 [Saprospiraceae bacterium]|nr:hypothetical protein [Candidatus Vicinibacter affinis]